MKVEIAEHGRMSESGSSLLRLIQNQNMPLLDLLVRESTQNSLDASIKGKKYVNVDFNVGKFKSDSLNKHFDGISHSLNKRFPASKGLYDYIEVRDSNTYGLTGPVKYEDVKDNNFGNLLKLVYEICKPQQNEGAGGSWGLGKTIYFRVGIGLVLYYSRIYQNGKYSSRLAACLVEDETKKEALIPYYGGVKRGIAWWGQKDGKNKTIPLDNERAINDVLSVFGIKPYQGEETGTTIIIPYINEESLLSEVYANNEEQEHKPFWASSVKEYLKASIQRWYAPRISNPFYPYGAYLSSSVCGEKIKISKMLPLFRVIRELYILAQNAELDSESLLYDSKEKHVEKIELRGVFSERAISGNFAYVKLDKKQLLMEAPENNRSPYQQISNSFVNMEGGNIPIVMYTRRPGMIVGYDYDGVWTHRMPKTSENEYVIGLFVLNSENRLKNIISNVTGENLSLEEYIRQGEKADHASWTDRNINGNNPRIVSNIQKNIIRKITAKYNEKKIDTTIKRNLGLGHALANILLPATDFGHTPHVPVTPPSPPVKPKPSKQHSTLSVLGTPSYENGKITLDFEIFIKSNICELKLFVLTDFKKYEADIWEDDTEIGTAFPLMVQSVTIDSSRTKAKNSEKEHKLTVDKLNTNCSDEDYYMEVVESQLFSVKNAVKISSVRSDTFVKGKFVFSSSDSSVKGVLDIKEVQS